METKPALRFDAREIAVVFSLFIFVSLLMFTVGIMVGKGLTQAKYEGKLNLGPSKVIEPLVKSPSEHPGTSVSIGAPHATSADHARVQDHGTAEGTTPSNPVAQAASPVTAQATATPTAQEAPLKLIPLKAPPAQVTGTNLSDPSAEAEALLKNPKIASLIESDGGEESRTPSSTTPIGAPKGAFTIQVGSYPDETAARERVDALKKMGFPQAFFSAKELGAANGTWYRVWLGYYPDYGTAKKMGDQLQGRGEVKNYIVRKAN